MNQREATELREALGRLEHGPGSGWRRVLEGTDGPGPTRSIDERVRSVEIWLDTWIVPAIKAAVVRYWKPNGRGGRQAPANRETFASRLRATLLEGEGRQARGVSPTGAAWDPSDNPAPYWIGFYHSIARQALTKLEELEARELEARR